MNCSVESLINGTRGLFLEIGGPSQHPDSPPFIDLAQISKPMIVTNHDILGVTESCYRHEVTGEEVISVERPADSLWKHISDRPYITDRGFGVPAFFVPEMWIDATDIIHGAGELGVLYTVALHSDVEPAFFKEATRTLEPGGILVVESTKAINELSIDYFSLLSVQKVRKRGHRGIRHFAAQRNDRPY